MASIWQITLSGYDAQAASESGQSATGKIALGTWGSYGHETIQVTLAEPWDVCTLVTATFWPTYPPDHWDTPGIRVALGTDGLLTVPPEATNRPTQTGRVVFEGLADNEKIISADVRYTVRDHAPTGGTESTATPSLLEQLLTQTGSNAQVAAQSADAAASDALAACWLVLILALAVFSAVLMDLLVVFMVPLAVEEACLMVLRPLSTVLMPFLPRSRVLMVLRS